MEKLYQKYKDRVEFLLVYIREAHPGSVISVPAEGSGKTLQVFPQTSTLDERLRNLHQFLALTKMSMPAVVDDEESSVKSAYASWPDRLYIVGTDGRIAYKGRQGPFGFRVPEVADWLRENVR